MKLRGNLANEALIAYGAYFALCAVLLFYNVQIANKVIKETEQKHYIHRMTNFCRVIDKCSLFGCKGLEEERDKLLFEDLKYTQEETLNFICFAKFTVSHSFRLNRTTVEIKAINPDLNDKSGKTPMQIIG